MKKIFVLAILAIISQIALSAITRKQIKFVDENGVGRTDLTGVTVLDQNTETASTLYTTEAGTTAITNPMTTTSTNTGINSGTGEVIFCSASNTFDMKITVGGVTFKFSSVKTTDKSFMVPYALTGTVVIGDVSNQIWVSTTGSDTAGVGTFTNPYATPRHAVTMITATRKDVLLMPGEYDLGASGEDAIAWPNISGVVIQAPFGGVTLTQSRIAEIFTISPTYTASTFEATLINIEFDVAGAASGVYIDNANMTKKLNVYVNNCTFSGEAADESIIVVHTSSDNAIRLYVNGGGETWEGIVTFACANTGDRLRIKNQILLGGITTTGDVAGEVFLENTGILTGAITIDNDHKLTTVGCWYQTDADPTVYTECANAFATY